MTPAFLAQGYAVFDFPLASLGFWPLPPGARAPVHHHGGDALCVASGVVCGLWHLDHSQVPAEHAAGYGPRFSALIGEIAGTHGTSRRIIQDFCASVLHVPISLGAIQKVLDRVAQAIEPHYSALATQARHSPVNYIDETPWFLTRTLQWLWVMANDTVAFYMIHPHRSKEAGVNEFQSYLIVSAWASEDALHAFVRSEKFKHVVEWGQENILADRPVHTVYRGPQDHAPCAITMQTSGQ